MEPPHDPTIFLLGVYSQCLLYSQQASYRVNVKCPSIDEWVKKTYIYTHKGIIFNYTKRWNLVICNDTDEPGKYYVKCNELGKQQETNIGSVLCQKCLETEMFWISEFFSDFWGMFAYIDNEMVGDPGLTMKFINVSCTSCTGSLKVILCNILVIQVPAF